MIVNSLRLAQFRAFDEAEFTFQPGMNLLVGVNGVGKTTALDALRVLLSQTLPEFYTFRAYKMALNTDDITIGRDFLTADLRFEVEGDNYSYTINKPREQYTPNPEGAGQVREQTFDTPETTVWLPEKEKIQKRRSTTLPLAIYFSSRRSLLSEAVTKADVNPQSASYRDALVSRELRVQEFADWWLTREALATEGFGSARPLLAAMNEAVGTFLDGFDNLRAERVQYGSSKSRPDLLIDKSGVTLNIRQLSDGERSVLALVLDLTRRLALANPGLENPTRDGQAVVLIDELDLHLHPRWQRLIVQRLTSTFPKCQFIASTHSPQIVGEVEAIRLHLIQSDGSVVKPYQSLGMDTNYVLQFIMEADERDEGVKRKLQEIDNHIEAERYEDAEHDIDNIRAAVGEFPELIRLQTRIDRIRMLSE